MEVDARPHNPAQAETRDLCEVVGVEVGLQRVAHKVLARRGGSREIQIRADVGAERKAGPKRGHAGVVQAAVHDARRLGIVGVGAQVHVGFEGLDGPAVAEKGAHGVLLAQIGGLGELAAGRQAHAGRALGHHRGVAGRHLGAVGNGILGVGTRQQGEEIAGHLGARSRVPEVGRMLELLAQRGVADGELQRVGVVHHGLQLVHTGRVGAGAVVEAQVLLPREAVVDVGIRQHVHEGVAPDAGPRELRVAVQLGVLAQQPNAGLVLGVDVPVSEATRLREVIVVEHVAQALVQLARVAGEQVVGVLVRAIGRVVDSVVALQHVGFGQGLGQGQVGVDAAAVLVQRAGLVEAVAGRAGVGGAQGGGAVALAVGAAHAQASGAAGLRKATA